MWQVDFKQNKQLRRCHVLPEKPHPKVRMSLRTRQTLVKVEAHNIGNAQSGRLFAIG
jgi:hypothetical protein